MKSLMVLAAVGLMAAVVNAHGPGGQGRPPPQGRPGGGPGAQRGPGDRPGGQGGPGGNRHDQNGENRPYSCVCGSQCATNTGTATITYACRKSRNQYLQCVGTTCSSQTCPADQLFNATSGVCEACPSGFHVDASKRRCVCNQGNTFDRRTRTCVTCPTDSDITADRCDCIYPALVNKAANACQTCPTGSTRAGKGCRCTDQTQFWNAEAFACQTCPTGSTGAGKGCVCADPKQFWNAGALACQNCPGSWVNVTKPGRVNVTKPGRPNRPVRYEEVCQCPTATDVFNRRTVTCVACPPGSTVVAKEDNSCRICKCTGENQEYDDETNTCVDRSTLDSGSRDGDSRG